eukprot:1114478-Karenia_brevis.AAC.1
MLLLFIFFAQYVMASGVDDLGTYSSPVAQPQATGGISTHSNQKPKGLSNRITRKMNQGSRICS